MTGATHIVDTLIAERASRLQRRPLLWRGLRTPLYRLLNYRAAVSIIDAVKNMTGRDCFEHISRHIGITSNPIDTNNIPASGPVIIIGNHPTGLADGLFVYEILKTHRPHHVYLANADALRVVPDCEDIIIPVEWIKSKRSPAKAKATLTAMKAAATAGKAIVIFPSGALAMMEGGTLTDRPWMQTAAAFARKHNIPIVPMHIKAQNSRLYYIFEKLNSELRDITLFREMLNKGGVTPDVTFGPVINPADLPANSKDATQYIRQIVEDLGNGVQ